MTAFSFPSYPPTRPLRATSGPPPKVIVVGAGIAGLSAAYTLNEWGFDVTVLEASNRPGGRILTLRDGFSHGLHADAGAAFIPGGHPYTVGFAQHFGLQLDLIPSGPLAPVDYLNGTLVSDTLSPNAAWPVPLSPNELGKTPLDWARAYAGAALGQILAIDPRSAEWPAGLTDIDAVSFAALLAKNGASPGAIRVLRLGYSDLWGDGVDSTSALLILRDMAWMLAILMANSPSASQPSTGSETTAPATPANPSDPALHPAMRGFHARQAAAHRVGLAPSPLINGTSLYRIRGGGDQLPKAFAKSLGHRIRYGAVVTEIEQSDNGVIVSTDDFRKFTSDRVIVTASYSLVRSMQFTPPLPDAKVRVIQGLRYTSVTRVFLEFSQRVWVTKGQSGTASTDLPELPNQVLPGVWIEDATQTQDSPNGILDCYYVGEWARRLGKMGENERVAFTLSQVEKVFPGAKAQFTGNALSKVWDDDPWTKGDYCWFAPGEMAAFCPQLATAVGRIHFAGDHTSALPGWMQGAIESGVRAANEINAAV